jgi:hypothetical protein
MKKMGGGAPVPSFGKLPWPLAVIDIEAILLT